MGVILIQSPCWGVYAPPLGLASLSAFLRQKGFQVLALDLNIDMFYRCKEEYRKFWHEAEHEFWRNEFLVKKLLNENSELINEYVNRICGQDARAVGFSVYDTSMYCSLELAKKIKAQRPDLVTVLGGPHCSRSMCGDFIAAQDGIDIVVEGEGEETLTDILGRIVTGRALESIPGAKIKNNTTVVDCPERTLIENLDSLPFPDFSDYPVGTYTRADTIPVATSRGCINRCVFCNEWPFWKRYRFKSGAYVFREIKHQLARYPYVRNIEFYDSLVNGNLKELSVFCDLLIAEGLQIRWSGQAAIRREMDFAFLLKCRRSGCGCLDYGFESASQRTLARVGKGFQVADAERIIKETYDAGIDVVLNFMFGLPGETEHDFQETLDFVVRMKRFITCVNPSPSFCGIAPGTYLYDHPEEFNISRPIDNGLFWRSEDGSNTYLVRLGRFEKFCELVSSLGIKSTYPTTRLVNRYRIIGDYYYHIRDYGQALKHYTISAEQEGADNRILLRISDCNNLLKQIIKTS